MYTLGTTTLGDLQYTYDAAGRRVQVSGSWARTGLPQAMPSATYNPNNQQVAFGGAILTHDLAGNLTSDGTNTYTWDARNRLTAVSGPTPASFGYDAEGRRSQKTFAGLSTAVLHDRLNPIQEQSGEATLNLLTGLAIDEFVSRLDATGTIMFLSDGLGSTVALTDNAGIVQTTYTYEPFGAATIMGSQTTNVLDYTGREHDPTGLKYYRARYYHPRLARFLSEDPLEFEAGDANLYAYAGNRPTDTADPLGLFGIEDLPTIPHPVVNAVAGFGDAFLIPALVRSALGVDDAVNKCSSAYAGGKVAGFIVGTIPFVARGAAVLGSTRIGHVLSHNRVFRIGPGRMPPNGPGLPGGTQVPRVAIGPERPGSLHPHVDLRSRIPYAPPLGGPQCGCQ